jgi:hypothetical protein
VGQDGKAGGRLLTGYTRLSGFGFSPLKARKGENGFLFLVWGFGLKLPVQIFADFRRLFFQGFHVLEVFCVVSI